MRPIDADALEKKFQEERKYFLEQGIKGAEHIIVHNVLAHLWEAPTIDAVPIEKIAEVFGNPPCQYTFDSSEVQGDEFMYEYRADWCRENCDRISLEECWKQFFKAWEEKERQ